MKWRLIVAIVQFYLIVVGNKWVGNVFFTKKSFHSSDNARFVGRSNPLVHLNPPSFL